MTRDQRTAASSHSRAPVLAVITLVGMGFVVPTLIVAMEAPSSNGRADVFLVATMIVVSARYAWIVGSAVRRPFEAVLWLFMYFFFGAAPMVQLRAGWPGTTPAVLDEYVAPAAAAGLVTALAVMLGSSLARDRVPSHGVANTTLEQVRASRAVLLGVIGLLAAAAFVVSVGPASITSARNELASAAGAGPVSVVIRAVGSMGLLVAFVALIQLRRQRRAVGRRWPAILTAMVLGTLLTVVNPISSSRYSFGTVALAIIAALGAYATVRRFRILTLGAVAGVLVVFPILDTFRRSLDAQISFSSPVESLTSGDFDAFAQTANALEFIQDSGVALGSQLLGPVFFWVPRSLWPDKPIDTGVLLAQEKGYSFTNLSAPLPAELLVNFSWLGLVLGMALVGYVLRILDVHAERQLATFGVPTVIGTVLPYYLLIVYRGSLLQATSSLVVLALASWFITERVPIDRSENGALVPRTSPTPSSRDRPHPARARRSSARRANQSSSDTLPWTAPRA